jgi:hypothetical protein
MPLRVFVSHSSKDKILANRIKKCIERFGLEVFVAHDDIKPSEEWQEKIRKELKRAHVFIAILTKAFRKSLWTDQEFGIALTSRAMILPLQVDLLPYGFMSKHQAHRLHLNDIDSSCLELTLKTIDTKHSIKPTFRRWLIHSLIHSEDFKTSIECSKLLNQLKSINARQANEIIGGVCDNDQVYGCIAAKYIKEFYKSHKNFLSERVNQLYKKQFESKA